MAAFLLEVGTEELPADFVDLALEQWRQKIPVSLAEQYLAAESMVVYGTPRRLAVLLQGLPEQQPDRQEEIKGPPAAAAFKAGKPTKAALGFARSRQVSVDDLEIRATDKGEFVFVQLAIPGRPTREILTDLVPQWINGLEGRRFMRWGDGDLRFPRPIRWLVALLDDAVLPMALVNGSEAIESDRLSRGHRVLHPDPVRLTQATGYLDSMRAAYVEADLEQRRSRIAEAVGPVAERYPDLLQEVTNLVEWPTAIQGQFEPEFLELPAAAIITIMIEHQRYFPVFEPPLLRPKDEPEAPLLPAFLAVSNGDPARSELIAAGNERVIRARLADGQFFYQSDRAKPLEKYVSQLETITFQADLGTVRSKVERLSQAAEQISQQLQLLAPEREAIQRTALLCKADLVTQMVYEFPELQGVMGQEYARMSGEAAEVAVGIFEHYLPRGSGDDLPRSLTGKVVGLADRLDTLVSIFGLGMLPTGSSDPFALRRAANAVVKIVWGDADQDIEPLPLNLLVLLQQLADRFVGSFATVAKFDAADLFQQLQDFFLQRIRTLLQDDLGIDYDLVNAALGDNDLEYAERALKDLLDVRDRAIFLQAIRQSGDLDGIYETVNRSTRLAAQGTLDTAQLDAAVVVNPDLFQQPSEPTFYEALLQLIPQTQAAQSERNYRQLVDALRQIAPTVSQFFDGPESVLVMDPDPAVQCNRLNLLAILRNHARILADFGAIVKN